MNVHAPDKKIQDDFKCLEWRGKRFTKNGKTYIRGKHKTAGITFYYSFQDNFAWFAGDI